MSTLEKKYFKHNFFAFVWHGVFLYVANAFTQITTVQASLIFILTGSSLLSGLLFSANRIGSIVPQLFFVGWVERSKIKKPFLIAAVLIRGTAMLLMAGILFFAPEPKSVGSVAAIFVVMLVFFFAGGMGDISYFAVFSKTIDPRKRGRNFGMRYFIGGILGLGAGYITKQILGGDLGFPTNYALLYLLSGLALYVAFAGFSSLKELPDSGRPTQTVWYRHFRIIKNNPNFLKFIVVEILLSSAIVLLPQYVIYAKQALNLPLSLVGLFVGAQIVGEIVAGPLWGRIGDNLNFRLVLFLVGMLSAFIPLLALYLPQVHLYLFVVVFFLIGMTYKGLSVGISNYLLEIAPKESVPSYVAVKNIMQLPTIIYPVLGGLLINYISYTLLFVSVSVILFTGTLLSTRLFCGRSAHSARLNYVKFWE